MNKVEEEISQRMQALYDALNKTTPGSPRETQAVLNILDCILAGGAKVEGRLTDEEEQAAIRALPPMTEQQLADEEYHKEGFFEDHGVRLLTHPPGQTTLKYEEARRSIFPTDEEEEAALLEGILEDEAHDEDEEWEGGLTLEESQADSERHLAELVAEARRRNIFLAGRRDPRSTPVKPETIDPQLKTKGFEVDPTCDWLALHRRVNIVTNQSIAYSERPGTSWTHQDGQVLLASGTGETSLVEHLGSLPNVDLE